jgi:chromosome segregation ATPase
MSKSNESPLLAAARALADDVARFETLSLELSRMDLNSDKALQRARSGLEACSAHETKLATSLRGFAEAMQAMQDSQRRSMELTAEAAARVRKRQQERAELQQRLIELGARAREVSEPVAQLFASTGEGSPDLLAPLAEVERRLDAVIDDAAAVCELARQGDWSDMERDTQSLREQLQALRNRVLLMRRKLSNDAPS